MNSSTHGANTSPIEISNIDRFGIWILLDDREYFLDYDNFPWFRNATMAQILNVELRKTGHLRWPDIDVDLSIETLDHPEAFPLIYR